MTGMSGTRAMLAIQWRAQRRRLLVWVPATVGTLAFTAIAVAQLYNTPEEIASYGQAVVSDALVAINGQVEGIDTLGGIIQDEFGFIASFLMPLIGLALIAGMTRREEEAGGACIEAVHESGMTTLVERRHLGVAREQAGGDAGSGSRPHRRGYARRLVDRDELGVLVQDGRRWRRRRFARWLGRGRA